MTDKETFLAIITMLKPFIVVLILLGGGGLITVLLNDLKRKLADGKETETN